MLLLKIILWSALVIFLVSTVVFVLWSKAFKRRALKKLAGMDTRTVRDWSAPSLEPYRQNSDELADTVVKSIMDKKELEQVNHLFDSITRDFDSLPENAPAELKDYFSRTAQLPDWADPDLIKLGQQVYIRHGVWISMLLCYKSLPECYACAKGAEVLHRTARLNKQHGSTDTFARRIAETAKFVMFTMSPGGMSARGKGIVATQKTRLIHAVIRYHIHQTDWDTAYYGAPINQQDIAGTLMSFSALILEGLEKMGIELEPVEKEAYIHCWRVIGHIVGLDARLIPVNSADALKLGYAILDQQMAASEHATELTEALLDFQDKKSAPLIGKETNRALFRIMLGNDIADLLHISPTDPNRIDRMESRIWKIAACMEVLDKSLVFAMLIQLVSRLGINLYLNRMSGKSILKFYLPGSLTKDWDKSQRKHH